MVKEDVFQPTFMLNIKVFSIQNALFDPGRQLKARGVVVYSQTELNRLNKPK